LDLRSLHPGPKPVFSPDDLASLVNTFREMGFTHEQKLAVLYAEDPHHRAKLFAFMGRLRGWHVCAFGSFEEAVVWLSDSEAVAKETAPEAVEQPVAVKARRRAEPPAKTKIRPRR
jgi:hypothetical protein